METIRKSIKKNVKKRERKLLERTEPDFFST